MVINWKLSKRESSDVERMTYVKKRARLPFCFTGFGRLQLLTVRTLLVFSSLRIAIRTIGFRGLHFLNYKQGKLVVVAAFFFFSVCNRLFFLFVGALRSLPVWVFFFPSELVYTVQLHLAGTRTTISRTKSQTRLLFSVFFLVAYTDFFFLSFSPPLRTKNTLTLTMLKPQFCVWSPIIYICVLLFLVSLTGLRRPRCCYNR